MVGSGGGRWIFPSLDRGAQYRLPVARTRPARASLARRPRPRPSALSAGNPAPGRDIVFYFSGRCGARSGQPSALPYWRPAATAGCVAPGTLSELSGNRKSGRAGLSSSRGADSAPPVLGHWPVRSLCVHQRSALGTTLWEPSAQGRPAQRLRESERVQLPAPLRDPTTVNCGDPGPDHGQDHYASAPALRFLI